jgi:predicted transcriptional regulator
MASVKQLMSTKGTNKNYSVEGDDVVFKALEIMDEANISAVMVTEYDKIVGIFTERDYSRKCELKGHSAKSTKVRNLMTEKMITVTPETSMDQCMGLMKQYHIRHLPVIENDKMIGMVSMRDVVDVLISERESTIKGLENYILGSGFAT